MSAKNETPAAKAGAAKDGADKAGQGQQAGKTSIGESTAGLAVSSMRDGFRRAGRTFSKQPTVIAVSELSEEEIEAIANEPMLSVRAVRIEPEAAESGNE